MTNLYRHFSHYIVFFHYCLNIQCKQKIFWKLETPAPQCSQTCILLLWHTGATFCVMFINISLPLNVMNVSYSTMFMHCLSSILSKHLYADAPCSSKSNSLLAHTHTHLSLHLFYFSFFLHQISGLGPPLSTWDRRSNKDLLAARCTSLKQKMGMGGIGWFLLISYYHVVFHSCININYLFYICH